MKIGKGNIFYDNQCSVVIGRIPAYIFQIKDNPVFHLSGKPLPIPLHARLRDNLINVIHVPAQLKPQLTFTGIEVHDFHRAFLRCHIKHIPASAADQDVVVALAYKRVIPRAAVKDVDPLAAMQVVIAPPPPPAQHILAIAYRYCRLRHKRQRTRVKRTLKLYYVTIEVVIACATLQQIVAITANQCIVARATLRVTRN